MYTDLTLAALMGQAVGDAFGAPIERHRNAPELARLSLEQGRYLTHEDTGAKPGRTRLPGLYTDDTQQALALLRARRHHPDDPGKAADYFRNDMSGMLNCKVPGSNQGAHRGTGRNFRTAVRTQKPVDTAGVGAAMRVGPVATTFTDEKNGQSREKTRHLIEWTLETSGALTSNGLSLAAGVMFALAAKGAKHGAWLGSLPRYGSWDNRKKLREEFNQLHRAYDILGKDGVAALLEFATGTGLSNKALKEPANGFALTTVPWAIWAGMTAESFEDALLKVTTPSGDVDTVAAMAGCLAAIRFGIDSIPEWMTDNLVGSYFIGSPEYWQPLGVEQPLTRKEISLRHSLLGLAAQQ